MQTECYDINQSTFALKFSFFTGSFIAQNLIAYLKSVKNSINKYSMYICTRDEMNSFNTLHINYSASQLACINF